MKEKRKLFVIDFSGDYEVWLSTSKEELLKNYKETTGIDILEEGGAIEEIEFKHLKDRFVFNEDKDSSLEVIKKEYIRLQDMDEDVMFFTNML